MTRFMVRAVMALSLVVSVLAAGCTQMPTEKQGVADVRPQLSFQLLSPELGTAQVMLDGLAMGHAGLYAAGEASLRVLPGTHTLQVVSNGRVVLNERIYVGDGVNKTFILK